MDEISDTKIEKEIDPVWVEDSVGLEEHISFTDAIMKWTDIVEEALKHHSSSLKDVTILEKQDRSKWETFRSNFKVLSSKGEGGFSEAIFPHASSQIIDRNIIGLGLNKMVAIEISMDIRVAYNPLDSYKIWDHLTKGILPPHKFQFEYDDENEMELYNGTQRISEIRRVTNRARKINMRDVAKASDLWENMWHNPNEVLRIIKMPLDKAEPGLFKAKNDWVSLNHLYKPITFFCFRPN